jgi:acyl carrier protein
VTKKPSSAAETLRKLVNKTKKRRDIVIQPNSTFKDLQIDSLEVVHIIVALEDELGIEIDDRDLKQISDMGAFISYLEDKVEKKESHNGKR